DSRALRLLAKLLVGSAGAKKSPFWSVRRRLSRNGFTGHTDLGSGGPRRTREASVSISARRGRSASAPAGRPASAQRVAEAFKHQSVFSIQISRSESVRAAFDIAK